MRLAMEYPQIEREHHDDEEHKGGPSPERQRIHRAAKDAVRGTRPASSESKRSLFPSLDPAPDVFDGGSFR